MKRKTLLGLILLFSVMLRGWGFSLENAEWNLGPSSQIENRDGRKILRVSLDKTNDSDSALPFARVDLTPFIGKNVIFSIKLRAEKVSRPSAPWLGIKFMLIYQDANGQTKYPGARLSYDTDSKSFDWQEHSFTLDTAQFELSPVNPNGKLCLGLQGSTGMVEFDLSSFKVSETEPTFTKEDRDYQAIYSERVLRDPPRRGMNIDSKTASPEDVERMAEWNVNLLRFQISIRSDKDEDYLPLLEKEMLALDGLLKSAQHYGTKVVVDLHSVPGGRDKTGAERLFNQDEYLQKYIEVWQTLATRYKGNPGVWAYDLINEPQQLSKAKHSYWEIQKLAAEAVRQIDPETPILITSTIASAPSAFKYLSPLKMKDVIYQVHMYEPMIFTHQGVHPSFHSLRNQKYPSASWNREFLRTVLSPVLRFQQEHKVRIYVGEFSAVCWAEGRAAYLQDLTSIFEEYGWDWTYHAFSGAHPSDKGWHGWSLEHSRNPEDNYNHYDYVGDTDAKRIILEVLQKNKRN